MKRFPTILVSVAACLLIASCGGGGGGSSTAPGSETSTAASSAAASFGADVQYTTENGDQVTAEYARPADKPNAPALLLLHQLDGSRHQWDVFAPQLLQAGYALLAPDLDYGKVNQCAAGSAGDGGRLMAVNNLLAVVNGGLLDLQSRAGVHTS